MQSIKRGRRDALKTIGAGLAASVLPAPFIAARAQQTQNFSGKTLRLLTWSDDTGLAALKNIAATFTAKTGAKVIADRADGTSGMVAKLKAAGDKPQYDVITLAGVGASGLADAGLLTKPDPDKLPNLKDVPASYRSGANGFGVGYLLWTDGLIYSTTTFKQAPTTYETMWDPKYAGRIFLPPPEWVEAVDMAIIAARLDGGSQQNIEPGFKKLAQLKDRVMTLGENPNQVADLFRTGSLDIGGIYSPAFFPDAIRKPEYKMGVTYGMKEGFAAQLMFTVIPKAHPGDIDLIHAFINHSLDAGVQGKMAADVLNGPVNSKAVIPQQSLALVPSPKLIADKAILHDDKALAAVHDQWIKRYTEIFSA
ncbi:ABC spermidine/putrescine transporter, periplasmic ligand binding protein [Caballeronia terrestris]|uniref:ABC spermidine/putrescine transporter, periplasmic ligand binding protein n=2 Tax=Caballeronia TaxID=1827195 RepID=A0A158K8H5_9BURK|nr:MULTISPECIES: extracellular solute-binding protein [Caballeronia]SAL61007.1 ABC spermidine/putrescine transporter, periplasmic ligand binding protein [Caballeronia humi]SAL77079.1 ABC spermidine/putrescine transporter, periplasmic ligand binding protein [Caballeronia terrestris]